MDFLQTYWFILLPLGIMAIVVMNRVIKLIATRANRTKRQKFLQDYTARYGYHYEQDANSFMASGSNSGGAVEDLVAGVLSQSQNNFNLYYQTEVIRGYRSSRIYERSVLAVDTPDILSHFVIKSKLNNLSNTGSKLEWFDRKQTLRLEGSFGDFFDVFAPQGDEGDVYTILAPNVMEYLIRNFTQYDIEINDGKTIVYAYGARPAEEHVGLLGITDDFLRLARLRMADARTVPHLAQFGQTVSRTATDNTSRKKLITSTSIVAIIFGVIMIGTQVSEMLGDMNVLSELNVLFGAFLVLAMFAILIYAIIHRLLSTARHFQLKRKHKLVLQNEFSHPIESKSELKQ